MTSDSGIYSNDQLSDIFIKMDPAQFQEEISKLTLEQFPIVLANLNHDKDLRWQQKIRAILIGLEKNEQLEALGKAMTLPQALEILKATGELDSVYHLKLLPIMVGLPHRVFEEIALTATNEQLLVLKHEAITEPIQHHLTVLLHEWAKNIEAHSTILHSLLKEISNFELKDITKTSLDGIKSMLASVSDFYSTMVDKINKALAIAWNTNRSDLIEKFTALKDSSLKYNSVVIGSPKTNDTPSTGMYALLDKRLDSVYSNGEGNSQDIKDTLDDDDPAIEGLSKLGLWYLQDYWSIGLLPGIEKIELLQEEDVPETDKEAIRLKERLYFLTVESLQNLGLVKIKDLKEKGIFSKSMLIDFIRENSSCLRG